MATTNTREKRAPVTLKIKFKSETLEQFIERYAVDISHGGIFIRTKDPLAVGTLLRFEFQLKDATPLITGEGTVVWIREADAQRAGVAPGMGVRFDKLPPESQSVLDRIMAQKAKGTADPFVDTPTRVVPGEAIEHLADAGLAAGATRRTLTGVGEFRPEMTPLPRPTPFASDLDDFPDEAFEEATKVASLDALAKASAELETSRAQTLPAEDDVPAKRKSALHTTSRAEAEVVDLVARRAAQSDSDAAAAAKVTAPMGVTALPPAGDAGAAEPRMLAKAQLAEPNLDDTLTPPPTPPPSLAVAAAPGKPQIVWPEDHVEEDRGSSSGPWIAAAAVLLVAAGAVGFGLINKKAKGEAEERAAVEAAATPATTASGTAADTQPTPAPAALAAVPGQGSQAPATASVAVAAQPAGTTIELVGTDQSGVAPFTITGLESGKRYVVRARAPGHLPREIEITAGAAAPEAIVLQPKPRVLTVRSTPDGAEVLIDGQRRGTTPLDVTLDGPAANKRALSLVLNKTGFRSVSAQFDLTANPTEEAERLAFVFERTLTAQPVAAAPSRPASRPAARREPREEWPPRESQWPPKEAAVAAPDKATPTPAPAPTDEEVALEPRGPEAKPSPGAAPPAATTSPETKPPEPTPGEEKPTPRPGEPTPDWMKK